MRRLGLAFLTIATVLGSSYAWAEYFPSTLNGPLHQIVCLIGVNQRGCCSHHHGVCDCHKGRVACCDGTLSPSCRC